MKTKMYGASDDLIEIEGNISEELDCHSEKKFEFSDGTYGVISYNGDWNIELRQEGVLFDKLIISNDEIGHTDSDAIGCSSYSDVLILNEGIEWVKIGGKKIKK